LKEIVLEKKFKKIICTFTLARYVTANASPVTYHAMENVQVVKYFAGATARYSFNLII
jgi:hypothetical protein